MLTTSPDFIRRSLLRYLAAPEARRRGLTVDVMGQLARAEGMPVETVGRIPEELDMIEARGMAALKPQPLSPEVRRYVITSAGLEFARDEF